MAQRIKDQWLRGSWENNKFEEHKKNRRLDEFGNN